MNLQIELETLKIDSEAAEGRLRDADARLKELEAREKQVDELGRKRSSLEATIAETKANLGQWRKLLAATSQDLKNYEEALSRLGELEAEALNRLPPPGVTPPATLDDLARFAEDLGAKLLDLRRQMTELQTTSEKSRATLQTLQGSNLCPMCRRPLDPAYKEHLSEELERDAVEGERQLELLNLKLHELNADYETALKIKAEIEGLRIQMTGYRERWDAAQTRKRALETEIEKRESMLDRLAAELEAVEREMATFNIEELERARSTWREALQEYSPYKDRVRSQERSIHDKSALLESLEERLKNAEEKLRRIEKAEKVVELVRYLREIYKDVAPSLRRTYIEGLREAVQSELDALMAKSGRSFYLDIDSEYTPILAEESKYRRSVDFVSGGERTWVALAYRVGLGQLVTEARTGQSLEFLILDEPTEALGSEDGSIDALATAISNLKSINQTIIVTHSAELAEKATARILVEKRGVESIVKNE